MESVKPITPVCGHRYHTQTLGKSVAWRRAVVNAGVAKPAYATSCNLGFYLYGYGPFPAPNGGPGFSGIDIGQGDQFKPEFAAVSPNRKIPVIIDHDPSDAGAPVRVFESGAILLYLAEKTGT